MIIQKQTMNSLATVGDSSSQTMSTDSKPPRYTTTIPMPPTTGPQDCVSCRIIGSGALGAAGLYALVLSRANAPGSVVGKRIVAGVGICEYRCAFFTDDVLSDPSEAMLVGSAIRWWRW